MTSWVQGRTWRWALGVVAFATLASACSKEHEDAGTASSPASGAVGAVVSPIEPAPPSPLEILMSRATLESAIAQVKDQMSDTDDETSPGALLLAIWAAKHLRWSEVGITKNETSFARIHKDPDAERGKRFCTRGRLIEIHKEKGTEDSLFSGLLMTSSGDLTSFLAAGSTGDLVARSRARFCGVAIGTYAYSNSGGGKGHAVSAVGMFDLPDNNR